MRVAVVQKDFLDTNPDRYGDPKNWVQTYTDRADKTYAAVGSTYIAVVDDFISPQPYQSWALDSSYIWQAPTAMPTDGKAYLWSEPTLAWVVAPPLSE